MGCGACLGCAVSVQADRSELASARANWRRPGRRRLVALGLLRALAMAVVLVALYYLLPLDHITSVPLALAGGLLILLAGVARQLRAIVRAKEPAVQAVVALASHRTGIPAGQPPQHGDGTS
jgi:O-antigen/teichoic acid export membrane protein